MENNRRASDYGRGREDVCMNSSELQKCFYSAYKSFFNVHDIVLSSPAVFTWGADISHGVSTLRIKQKLPTKTFCGANINTSGKVTFRKIHHYSILENIFKEDNLSDFFRNDTERISLFLENFLAENEYSGGMEIDFLSEVTRGHGFAFTGAVSVLLTFLVYSIIGKIDTATLMERELDREKIFLFDELYEFSLKLSNCISQGKNIGHANNYTLLLPNNSLPIVYFSEKNTLLSINTLIHKDILPTFLGIEITIEELPLDYGVIFTGIEHTFSDMEFLREQSKKEQDRLKFFIKNILHSSGTNDKKKLDSSDISFLNQEKIENDRDDTNFQILEGFDYLLKNPHNDSSQDAFINIIQHVGLMSFAEQKENKLFFALKYFFDQYRQFEDEEIGIIPFNTGKIGGSLLFVMKHKKSRVTIQKVLEQLRGDGYIALLDYASWRDGNSADGIRFEQYITKSLYSSYTEQGNVQFTDTFGKTYFGNYHAIIENEKDCILLDPIGTRVYIGGTKLTSKEIHSQSTTIDVLKILLENIGKEVPNSLLPNSSYSQNKSEIMSKVVLPLRKLVKKHFGKDIPLSCSGGITSYYLRLERDTSIRIGIIKKQDESPQDSVFT